MYLDEISSAQYQLRPQMRHDILICRLYAFQQILWLFYSFGNTDKLTAVIGLTTGTCKEFSLGREEPEAKINEQKIWEASSNLLRIVLVIGSEAAPVQHHSVPLFSCLSPNPPQSNNTAERGCARNPQITLPGSFQIHHQER